MAESTKPVAGSPLKIFDPAFYFLLLVCIASGGAAIFLKGPNVIWVAIEQLSHDLLLILPQITLGVLVGAFFTLLVPQRVISRMLGEQTGLRGIVLAGFIGSVMPGGPFTSFPLVFALGRAGAGIGALVAFLVAWAAIGVNRLIIWEIPFMGVEFAMLRFFASLPLPIIAGVIAARLSGRLPIFTLEWDDH